MATTTVDFSLSEEETCRLDHLAETYAQGDRDAFLRLAMTQMEVLERSAQLADLSDYGAERLAAQRLTIEDIPDVVHRGLSPTKR